jgi:signal transduction histidine kinase
MSEAIRAGEALFFATSEERDLRFPVLRGLTSGTHALAVLPLLGRNGAIGGLALRFDRPRTFSSVERPFLQALANQAAQALERTQLAEALEREREQFRSVLEQMPSGVIIAEAASGKVMLANDQVSTIWRRPFVGSAWAVGEQVGNEAFRLDGTPLASGDWPLSCAIDRGEVVVNELIEIRRGDGTLGIIACSAAPIHDDDGRVVAGVVVFSDVTERIHDQREIERRAEAARALAFVADGVCLVDQHGVVRVWNGAAERGTGVPAAEIVGAPLRERIPGWAAIAGDIPVAPAGSEMPPRPTTLPLELPGGERWLAIVGVDFGEGVVYAFRDVTEEQQLETLKSDFIATVSHELRTPLAAVYGAAATLRQRSSLDPEERELFLAMIEDQAERLSRIVNEILIASRLDSGELQINLSTVDAGETAEQVAEVARRGAPGFELEVSIHDDLPAVLADPDRLAQVLGNLVENAIKYSGESRKVAVRVEPTGASVRFVVSDDGLGIAQAEHERIFEKFYRVDPAMTGGVSGTGLGLYIVRELVERMDGRIAVESALGAGSRFEVELPAVAQR